MLILGVGSATSIGPLALSTLITPLHLCNLQTSHFWNIKPLIIFKPIIRMHPNCASIHSSDLPIIIYTCGTPSTPSTDAPSNGTLMATATSYYSATTRSCCFYPSIITFNSIFIRESLINYITVIYECRGVGQGNGDNAHLHLYGRLHGIEKVGPEIFIE